MNPIVKQAKDAFDAWCAGTRKNPFIEVQVKDVHMTALSFPEVALRIYHALQDPSPYPSPAVRTLVYREYSLRGMKAHSLMLEHASDVLHRVRGDDPDWMDIASEYTALSDVLDAWYTTLSNNPTEN